MIVTNIRFLSRGTSCGSVLMVVWLLGSVAGCSNAPSIADAYNDMPHGNAAVAYAHLGREYLLRGSFDFAEARLRHAIQLNPKLAAAHHDLAVVCTKLGNWGEADKEYRIALELTPNDPTAIYNYATLLYNQGHYPEAEVRLLAVVANPQADTHPQSYEALGWISLKKNDTAKAEGYFRQALDLSPNMPGALLDLAKIYLDSKRLDLAQSSFQHYQELVHDTPEGLWFGIQMARAQENGALATDYSQRLRLKFPDSEQARQLYAERHH